MVARTTIREYVDEVGNAIINDAEDSIETTYSSDKVETLLSGKINTDGTITSIIKLTQAEYDALTPVSTTLYIIVG